MSAIPTLCCSSDLDDSSHYLLNADSGDHESAGSGSKSTHFSQRDNPTVVRDAQQAAMVDLSAVRKKYKGEGYVYVMHWFWLCLRSTVTSADAQSAL